MIELPVRDAANNELRKVGVSEVVFGKPLRADLISLVVKYQLAKRRQGDADTKTRSEVSGGGRKPYKQKGTGHARQGTIRAPQFRTGGVVFGPHPRSYEFKLNKKVRRLALQSALSAKCEAGEILVVDDLRLQGFSTKGMQDILQRLDAVGSALVVIAAPDENIERSSRNLPGISVIRTEGVNVYDLLAHTKMVITEAALRLLEERLA